ncbi:MAG: DNA-binding protein [Eubacterium sp.]|nr:DNA-binding protein [Eubacterium sp.]
MEKIVRQSLLYDFYGELLTEHQKQAYEDIVFNDMSYAEIARTSNISRQGAYDMIKRCDKLLEGYEEKLHLVNKFLSAKEKITEIQKTAELIKEKNKDAGLDTLIDEILTKSEEIFEEL